MSADRLHGRLTAVARALGIFVAVGMFLALGAAPAAPASAQTLVGQQQLAASRPFAGDTNRMRVWAVRDDDHLVSLWQDGGNIWHWNDHGAAPSGPLPMLAAASYELGSDHHERVWFVAENGRLYEYDLTNNSTGAWTWYAPPAGTVFTGELAALAGSYGGQWYVATALTATDGTLWRGVGYATGHSLAFANSGSAYDIGAQVTATTSPDNAVWTFFSRKTDGTAGFVRWTGSAWLTGSAGRPADANVGWSLGAAQGYIASGTYALNLWTTSDLLESKVRVATTTSPTSTTFSWTYTNTSSIPLGYFGLAAAARADGAYSALDAFVHTTNDHLYRDTRTGSGWPWTAADQGTGLEMQSNIGDSVTAMGTGFGYSRPAWLGAFGSASYVYSRMGYGGPNDLWLFLAHGDHAVPQHRIDLGATFPHTEAMMDDWRGRAIAAAIVRPSYMDGNPANDYAFVQAMWSTNDGESWQSPVTMPSTVAGSTYNYVTDPTVAFTDGGKAYVGLIGWNFPGDCVLGSANRSSFYFTTTTTGAAGSYTTPVQLDGGPGVLGIDHGWLDVDRARTPDRLHFVWVGGAVKYRCLDDGATCPTSSTACCEAPCSSAPCRGPLRDLSTAWGVSAGPPTLSVAGSGAVFVAWASATSLVVCKLRSDLTGCEETPFALSGAWAMDPSRVLVPGTGMPGEYINAAQAWSVAAAQHPVCPPSCPACEVLYYAYQKTEGGGSLLKDIYASRGTYCTTTRSWSWSTPVPIPTVHDDGVDQFGPSLTVLSDGGTGFDDQVLASWYDRRTTCAVTGFANRCLRLFGAKSTAYGLSWVLEAALQSGALTDPHLLPYHCIDPAFRRFIGDYHDHQANLLHAHALWCAAPEGGAATTGQLWQSFVSKNWYGY